MTLAIWCDNTVSCKCYVLCFGYNGECINHKVVKTFGPMPFDGNN